MAGTRRGTKERLRPSQRWTRGLLALAVVSVVGGLLVFITHRGGSGPELIPELVQAKRTGKPVEVKSARTSKDTVWALPSGAFRREVALMPVRARQGGKWAAVDLDLVRRSDGRVTPRVSAESTVLSGGGKDPLLVTDVNGVRVTTGWATKLPRPTLSGPTATYSDVYPGVDLKLTVTDVGTSQVLVVKNKTAARTPALRAIRQPVKAKNGAVAQRDGELLVLNDHGVPVGGAPAAVMWDSTTAATQPDRLSTDGVEPVSSAAVGAGPGAHVSVVSRQIHDGTVVLRPDKDALTGEGVKYPVFIDPAWSSHSTARTMTRQQNPNTSYYGWTNSDYGFVGNNQNVWTQRLYWRFDVSSVSGATIDRATFADRLLGTSSCTNRTVQLWKTGAIASYTNWNSTPTQVGLQDQRTDAVRKPTSSTAGCNATGKSLEFDATAGLQASADDAQAAVTFGMRSTSESTINSYMFFDRNPTLSITYRFPPDAPTDLDLVDPNADCAPGKRPQISGQAPRLSARFKDKDRDTVKAVFAVYPGPTIDAGENYVWSETGTAGVATEVDSGDTGTVVVSEGRVELPDANADGRPDNGTYTWRARAVEEGAFGQNGTYSATCTFDVVDNLIAAPGIDASAVTTWDVGTASTVTLTPLADTSSATVPANLAYYRWSLNSNVPTSANIVATATNKKMPLILKPAKAGLNILRVWAYTTTGSTSAPTTLEFDAHAGTAFAARYRLDGNGTNSAQNTLHLTIDNALLKKRGDYWVKDNTGPGSTFSQDSLFEDDGASTMLTRPATTARVLDSTSKFTVSAWVDPGGTIAADETAVSQGQSATVFTPTFALGVSSSCPPPGTGTCYYVMLRDSAGNPKYATLPRATTDAGHLTQLVGDFNPGEGLRLRAVIDGRIVSSDVTTIATPQTSTGVLTIGGAKNATTSTGRFTGRIDDVTLLQGLLDNAAVVQLHATDGGRCYSNSQDGDGIPCAN